MSGLLLSLLLTLCAWNRKLIHFIGLRRVSGFGHSMNMNMESSLTFGVNTSYFLLLQRLLLTFCPVIITSSFVSCKVIVFSLLL